MTVTVAPGTAAAEASRMVPTIAAVGAWACSGRIVSAKKTIKKQRERSRSGIIPPSHLSLVIFHLSFVMDWALNVQ
jgi:hypothetical protein